MGVSSHPETAPGADFYLTGGCESQPYPGLLTPAAGGPGTCRSELRMSGGLRLDWTGATFR